jgi:hypothetical protein
MFAAIGNPALRATFVVLPISKSKKLAIGSP